MALIVCKNCGRKISDTSEQCIHCGTPLKEENVIKAQKSAITKEKNPIDFSYYGEDERISLEKEFLESDLWAKRYYRTKLEINSFFKTFFMAFSWVLILFIAVLNINEDFFASGFETTVNGIISIGSFVILGALSVVMFIYSSIKKIYLRVTFAKYVYMKKFQKWLMENKHIDYTPPLVKIKQKEIFDSIRID